jgi:predicted MFS family arabinose efflux permease
MPAPRGSAKSEDESLTDMERERRFLQRTVAVVAIVPVLAGLYGVLFGIDGIGGGTPVNVSADSHFRYLSGLLTGIGILFFTCVPGIEDKSRLFRFLTLVVVLGGLARLLGLSLTGVPSLTMLAALALELVVTPLLCLWQMRVARQARDQRQELAPGLETVR